jgi:eukaryotic-like serine/threonine-protein kinase
VTSPDSRNLPTSKDEPSNSKEPAQDKAPALDQAATMPDLIEKTLDTLDGGSGSFLTSASGELVSVSPSKPEQLVGSIFDGKYEILSLLGQGGMSAVFKAKNLVLNRIVAIKILLGSRNLNEQSLMRFQQEARAASQLDHHNIVKVHDFSVSIDLAPYMVMDYVEGNSIAEIITVEGQLDPYRALDLILQACDALEHAHQQGVVHRDLKPSNIMVTKGKNDSEVAKIVDFGVAKIMEEEQGSAPQLTRTGEVFGSPLYMSPEQCLGKKVDARTDIYSLACVLFEELTGMPPFRADNVLATMHMHISDAPPEVTKLRTDLPNGAVLSSILLTALSKNPDQRFQSMRDFSTALQKAALKPQTRLGKILTLLNIFRKTKGSNRKLPMLTIIAASTILVGGASLWALHSLQEANKLQEVLTLKDEDVLMSARDKLEQEYLLKAAPIRRDVQDGRKLTDGIVPFYLKEPQLQVLYLRHTKISGLGFDQLTKGLSKQLTGFSCSGNTHLMPNDLMKIVENLDGDRLNLLAMQSVRATDDVVAAFSKFKVLENLEISGSDITPNVFKRLPEMRSVKKVMVNDTAANDETLRDIAEKFPNLEGLHLRGTKVTDAGLRALKKLPLRYMSVSRTNLSEHALAELKAAIGSRLKIDSTPKD